MGRKVDIINYEKEIINGINDNSNIFIVGDFQHIRVDSGRNTANKVFDLLNEEFKIIVGLN